MTASAIYLGRVTHDRWGEVRHHLAYRVWYLLLDLDELDALDRDVPWFTHGRAGAVSFHDVDQGPRDGTPLRPWAEMWLDRAGIDLEGGAIRVLAFPRVFGYVFNPLSVWFCHHADGSIRAVLYEVSNTYGQRHSYLVPVQTPPADGRVRRAFAKELHVSPFIGMDATYDFSAWVPDERLRIAVRETTGTGPRLTATLTGRRVELSRRAIVRALVAYPLLTLKVIAGIHWEALKLWRKGAPYRRPGPPPTHEVTILPTNTPAFAQSVQP